MLRRTNNEAELEWLAAHRGGCREPVVKGFSTWRKESLEIDSIELVGGQRHAVPGVRMPETREAVGIPIETEFYNVLAKEVERKHADRRMRRPWCRTYCGR